MREPYFTPVGLLDDLDCILYRRFYNNPFLRCIHGAEVSYLLKELHHGSPEWHCGPRTLALEAPIAGYYWPTMRTHITKFYTKVSRVSKAHQHNPLASQTTAHVYIILALRPLEGGCDRKIVADSSRQ